MIAYFCAKENIYLENENGYLWEHRRGGNVVYKWSLALARAWTGHEGTRVILIH